MAYKIKERREKKKMTQQALADKAGVSRQIISRLENEEGVITTTDTLKKIASALGCKVGDIFLD